MCRRRLWGKLGVRRLPQKAISICLQISYPLVFAGTKLRRSCCSKCSCEKLKNRESDRKPRTADEIRMDAAVAVAPSDLNGVHQSSCHLCYTQGREAQLVPILAVFGRRLLGYTLDKSPVYRRDTQKDKRPFTLGTRTQTIQSNLSVFGLWEEARGPERRC